MSEQKNPIQEIIEMKWELKEIAIHQIKSIIEQLGTLKSITPEYHELNKQEKQTVLKSYDIIIDVLETIIDNPTDNYVKIRCNNCGHEWELTQSEIEDEQDMECPDCCDWNTEIYDRYHLR